MNDFSDERQRLAARNNAEWCDAVCRAHGLATEFAPEFWLVADPAPPFYPNLVTLAEGVDPGLVARATGSGHRAVKDSFADLELSKDGFVPLFEARWLWLERLPRADASPWIAIETDGALARWELAWREGAGEVEGWPRIFPPALLEERGSRILGVFEGDRAVAGVVATRSDGVVGLSNFFAPERERMALRQSAAAAASAAFPLLPLTGYDRDAGLEEWLACGFADAGALRVWMRP